MLALLRTRYVRWLQMANEGDAFTLWNSPMSNWTSILEEVTVTQELLKQSAEEHQADLKEVEERLKPFKTAITEETLSQLVR